MEKIKVGVLGFGLAGRVFHIPLLCSVPDFEIVAICTSRAEEVAKLDAKIQVVSDSQQIFSNPDINLVVIATPNDTHSTLATQALKAGKHVVVDKPFALNYFDAKEVVELARATQRGLFAFHNRRWDSDYLSIKEAIQSGVIGEVVVFESHFDRFRPEVRDRWKESGDFGTGVWWDLGPHLVDQAICLFGKPLSVFAEFATLREGGKSIDFTHVILRYEKLRVILQANMNTPDGSQGGPPRFLVSGRKGSLIKRHVDPQETQLIVGLRPGDADFGVDPDPLEIYDGTGSKVLQPCIRGCQDTFYRLVAQQLKGEQALHPISLEEMLLVQQILELAIESAKQNKVLFIS